MTNVKNVIENIGKDDIEKIKSLFKKIKKTSEFEFIFFSNHFKNVNLSLEKYIMILKYLKKKSSIDKTKRLIGNNITLDISYNPDKNTTYRCTLENTQTINKYMQKLHKANNHVILKNLIKQMSKDNNITAIKKSKDKNETIDVENLYMRIRLSNEENLTDDEIALLSGLNDETMKNISFRFKERTTMYIYEDKNSYIKIDLTKTRTEMNYEKINTSIPRYELEIEAKMENIDLKILDMMFMETETLFKIYQQSNYVVYKFEAESVIQKYRELLIVPKVQSYANSLYGRQPVSLEIQYVENLSNKFAVTDKADGERNFLFIVDDNVYFINKNLNVKKSGIVLNEKNRKYNNSVMDGELLLLKNKLVFLVFDCLFNGGKDVRKNIKLEDRLNNADEIINNCFVFENQRGYNFEVNKNFDLDKTLLFHKNQINNMFINLNYDIDISIKSENKFPIIRRKYFMHSLGAKKWEIYAYSSLIWNLYSNDTNIKCPYILDGLIYQPNDQEYIVEKKLSKEQDYKWKPIEKNSIDFYIEFLKDIQGNHIIAYDNTYSDVSQDNNDNDFNEQRLKNLNYKICRLYVGQEIDNKQTPVLFKEKEGLHEAYLLLTNGEVRDDEGNMLSDKTVVEFCYDTNENTPFKFRWRPLRTRYDKTEAVIKYNKQYGNHITTAESVWLSIKNPILMSDFDELSQGNNPDKNTYFYDKKMESIRKRIGHEQILAVSKDSYFQERKNIAKPMRAFHNFIKDNIIYTFCHTMYGNKKKKILDVGIGLGQDNMKYYYAKVNFVVGIDIDYNALYYSTESAVGRYNKQKNKPGFPNMYFIQADFCSNFDYESQFKSLKGMNNENKLLMEKFFSEDKSKRTLFDVISAQFSFHYSLKNDETFKNMMNNINNYLNKDGYLLITTFDAIKVRQLLKDKEKYTKEYTDENGKVQTLFEIVKKYKDEPDDVIMGTGNCIDVFMTWFMSENKYHPEYLVDSRYLIEQMDKVCNLDLISTDSFENQYKNNYEFFMNYIQYEPDKRTKKYLDSCADFYKDNSVNNGSRIYSSLYRYYVFRKRKNDKVDKMEKVIGGKNKYSIQTDINYKYSTYKDYSFLYSVYDIFKKSQIIPQSLSMDDFYLDINYEIKTDDKMTEEEIQKLSEKIIIFHSVSGKKEKILDCVNIILVERDCNGEFYKKQITNNEKCKSTILLSKENDLYTPVFEIDKKTNEKIGIITTN